jgi:hypothetical protein
VVNWRGRRICAEELRRLYPLFINCADTSASSIRFGSRPISIPQELTALFPFGRARHEGRIQRGHYMILV